MRRLLLVATFCSALSLLPAWAQMRGGGLRGGGGFRGAPMARPGLAPRAPMMTNRGLGFVPAPRSNFHFRTGFNNNAFFHGNFHHHHHHFLFTNGFGPWWWNSGWGWNPWWYGAYSYPSFWDSPSSSSYDSANYEQQRQMATAIDELGYEVQRLREQQEQARVPASPSPQLEQPQAKPEPARPTVLVFRDQHTQEVNNYAIVGQTLWVFNEQRARKIPLSELDVPATTAKNDERGIEFRLPASR
jgi:hypothetical protein